ncbi:MAG: FHA domain-containing protein [Bacteroidales bacterium]|jgi:hypothetical protein|nr:FHA domain-containing protein [Bacteroidales bacterium]
MSKKLILLIIVFLFSIIPNAYNPIVEAQTSPSRFEITNQYLSGPATNTVFFYSYNVNGVPLSGLKETDIKVYDNESLVDFNFQEKEVGVRVLIVIDAGLGIDARGATNKSRLEEIKEFINSFLSRTGVNDSVMVVSNENRQLKSIVDFGTSTSNIIEKLKSYNPNPTMYSDGVAGINKAFYLLQDVNDEKKEIILFLTPGLETSDDKYLNNLTDLMKAEDAPIVSTILFRGDEKPWDIGLKEVATIGNGNYLYYNNSSKDFLDPFFEHVYIWKNQYVIDYRIPELKNGTHVVSIVNASNTIKTSASYRLNINFLPPKIQILSPLTGAIFNQSGVEPILIEAQISFPDGVDREIASVSLIANGSEVYSLKNPENYFVSIPWDSSTFKVAEETAITFTIEAVDSLGKVSTSDPVIVTLKPVGIGLIATTTSPTFLSYLIQYGGFLLGLVAVILVFVFRKPLAVAGGTVVEKFGEAWESITKPRKVLTPKAYLEVVSGQEPKSVYDIYETTPIGRSRRNADLIFQAGEENSPISRLHCTIINEDDVFYIRDEDSQWGTFLNGQKLEPLTKYELSDNDEIAIAPPERGGIIFKFNLASSSYIPPDDFGFGGSQSYGIDDTIDGDTTRPVQKRF